MASDGAVKRTRGNRDEIQHERDDAEGIRARAAAQAACKRKIGSQQGLSGFWKRALRMYQQADDVVSMPFLIGLSLILSACTYFSSPGRPPVDVGEGGGEEWRWVQGVGKDVVGKVNCTTYLHIPSGVLVELGHGSGGGLAFKVDEKSKVRWVWEDGRLEEQDSLACPDVETSARGGAGRKGKPKAMMFNRYNRMFWVGTADDNGGVTYRNANNPVTLELVKDGFRFTSTKLTILSVMGGVLKVPLQPEGSEQGKVEVVQNDSTTSSA